MRYVTRPITLALAGAMSATGCATAHLNGEYAVDGVPVRGHEVVSQTDKHTIAEGSDWVFFWGIVEVASDDLGDSAKEKMHTNEVLTETEVANHISLPGALLWLVTAGLVSHHDLTLRGRVATVTAPPERIIVSQPVEHDRTIIINGGDHHPAVHESTGSTIGLDDMFATAVIDRPLADVESGFRDAADRAGLKTISEVNWNDLSSGDRAEAGRTVPSDRIEGVADSNIRTFGIANATLASDVRREPRCGAMIPGVVLYERDGKTHVVYMRGTQHLRALEQSGQVGEGKSMTRSSYEEHLAASNEFEASLQKLVGELDRRH